MRFDRDKYLDPSIYEYTDEETVILTKACHEIDMQWWKEWTNNVNANIKKADKGKYINSIYGRIPPEQSCLIVGSGPSLDRHMDKVRYAKDKLKMCIVAVDNAYKKLIKNDIVPQIVVSCDAQAIVAPFLEGIDKRTSAFLSLANHPEVVTLVEKTTDIFWHAPLNPFSSFWQLAYKKYGKRMATTLPGYIVTFSAVSAAVFMGFDFIFTVGNDLCYESEDTAQKSVAVRKKEEVSETPCGRWTTSVFKKAAVSFTLFPFLFPDVKFYDWSGGIVQGFEPYEPRYKTVRFGEKRLASPHNLLNVRGNPNDMGANNSKGKAAHSGIIV